MNPKRALLWSLWVIYLGKLECLFPLIWKECSHRFMENLNP